LVDASLKLERLMREVGELRSHDDAATALMKSRIRYLEEQLDAANRTAMTEAIRRVMAGDSATEPGAEGEP
jgi:hypothetical protein